MTLLKYLAAPCINIAGDWSWGLPILKWLWEYVYFILLSSSERKYDPFTIV